MRKIPGELSLGHGDGTPVRAHACLPIQEPSLLVLQPLVAGKQRPHRADPLRSPVQHALNRGPPGLEVVRLPMRLCRGLVAKDLEVVEAVGRVGIGQDMKLEDAWLITNAPRDTRMVASRNVRTCSGLTVIAPKIAYMRSPFEVTGRSLGSGRRQEARESGEFSPTPRRRLDARSCRQRDGG
jgi:hypothetical protein